MTTKKDLFVKDFLLNKSLYLMMLPVLIYYAVFHYAPMYGAIIAFKDYSPMKGIMESDWVGLQNFKDFMNGFIFGVFLRIHLFLVYIPFCLSSQLRSC